MAAILRRILLRVGFEELHIRLTGEEPFRAHPVKRMLWVSNDSLLFSKKSNRIEAAYSDTSFRSNGVNERTSKNCLNGEHDKS